MADLSIKKDMLMRDVKKIVESKNIDEESKKLIFDFCNKDLDGVVTDDIELHILNTWMSGEKKIPMPKIRSNDNIIETPIRSLLSLIPVYKNVTVSKIKETRYTKYGIYPTVTIESKKGSPKNYAYPYETRKSELTDSNADGYADFYISNSNNIYKIDKHGERVTFKKDVSQHVRMPE